MDPLQTITTAAQSSDRWLFLSSLFVMGSGAIIAFRWLVGIFLTTVVRLEGVIERNTETHNRVCTVLNDVADSVKFNRRD